ncbi:50S ribosomal protein L6 [Candidatus Berkelbacteria bacterium]|nr:50S ribosomal protein L6 [Candidatus Berkelbacteria bacterium]
MSRIGRRPIKIPQDVTVTLVSDEIIISGPKGELKVPLNKRLGFNQADSILRLEIKSASKLEKSLQGLTARLITGAIEGVTKGFIKKLELHGVGYRAALQDKNLTLAIGFSHPVFIHCPEGIEFTVQKNTINVGGINKQLVGQTAAEIRRVRPPEPYKGKGIRYSDEIVRRKAGKAAKATGAA